MGWMNDMLRYGKLDPLFRKGSHTLVTFAMMYAYSENFILPLSHDEVVHEKKSLVDKMPGDYWQKFAGLRGFFGFMMAHPGKKLLFMGGEFAQFIEWYEGGSLDWHLLSYEKHAQMLAFVKDLNHFYLQDHSLWEQDHHRSGFQWIDPDDADAGVVSFLRFGKAKDDFTVVVCNFTPIGRENYPIGVPKAGEYHEALNSDALIYGGSGQHHQEALVTIAEPRKGQHQTLLIGIPPLAVLYLKYGEVKAS